VPAAPPPLRWLDAAPFFQAGLQGYSDAAMRLVARRHGAPYCVTESMGDLFLLRGGKALRAAELDGEDHPVAGQLMGSRPADMARAARILIALGYDVVDVNLACPVKRLRGEPRGGYLLAEPEQAVDILKAVREAVSGDAPVTVKLRRAFDDSAGAERDFHRVLEAAVELGYAAATVHGRTVVQKYIGPASWPFLADLAVRYPGFRIFGSGDVFTADAVPRMLSETGVRAVAVARGAIGNPWIFREAHAALRGEEPRAPSVAEQRSVLEEHCALAVRFLGAESAGRTMRMFGIKFSRHHPRAAEVARAFIAVRTLESWREVLRTWYSAGGFSHPEPPGLIGCSVRVE
jgi:nifR3 family TIM-barrel protein